MSLNKSEINTQLAYAINELRAIEAGNYRNFATEGQDRKSVAERLRAVADSLEAGGVCPDTAVISHALAIPVQE